MTSAATPERVELEELVRQHQAGVWRYLRFMGCDTPQADDLTQETFLAVVRKPFEVRTDRETAAYLRTTARRQMLMYLRKRGREPVVSDLEAAEAVWAAAAGDDGLGDYLDALRECLKSAVNGRAREAIDMQYRDRLSRGQIAERLGIGAEGVKTLLRRARASLRECVERKLNLANSATHHVAADDSTGNGAPVDRRDTDAPSSQLATPRAS